MATCVAAVPVSESDSTAFGKELQEVTVGRSKEKYSKRNNPAVDFSRLISNASEHTDPHRNDFYNYSKYERITFGFNDFSINDSTGRFAFLRDHIEMSPITGRPILPMSIREKIVDVIYRKNPKTEREYVRAKRMEGIDELMTQQMNVMFEDYFREIDLYDGSINLLQKRFVSPLSKLAPDFYKFYLTDTVIMGHERLVELSFAPRNRHDFGFVGRIYVVEGDSTMFVRKVDMSVSPYINVNYLDNMRIAQTFDKAPDGSRLKRSEDFLLELALPLPGANQIYLRKQAVYGAHNFEVSPHADLFNGLARSVEAPEADTHSDDFWTDVRYEPITYVESQIGEMMGKFKELPLFRLCQDFIARMSTGGYFPTAKKSKFDIGPLFTFLSFNDLEGTRLRFGGMTTAQLNPRWFVRGYGAYGFRDHKWKYGGELEYSFVDKKLHSREFPIHSIRLSERYDVNEIGQNYAFTSQDNIFISFKHGKNRLVNYLRESRLDYTLELENTFSVVASVANTIQDATKWVPLRKADGTEYKHTSETYAELQLRYAPGEKFIQGRTRREPVNLDAPVFVITQQFAPSRLWGNRHCVNITEMSIEKRIRMSVFGHFDFILKMGHVWSQVSFLELLTPNVNLSYTIQPQSFALLRPMEFINDSFCSWDLTYWGNGLVFNRIPILNRLKLREVCSFCGWIGSLSVKNDPTENPNLFQLPEIAQVRKMDDTPYMEMSVGLDNIFSCVRVDFVWRLTYRDVPSSYRQGVRAALHFQF